MGRATRPGPRPRRPAPAGPGARRTGSGSTARWLGAVLAGRTGWEDLFLSLRFTARRDPDVYNDYLVGLLKHADAAALAAVEQYEAPRDPDETS